MHMQEVIQRVRVKNFSESNDDDVTELYSIEDSRWSFNEVFWRSFCEGGE